MKQQHIITHWPRVLQDTKKKKKLDWSLIDQHLSMQRFYENIRTSNIFFGRYNISTEDVSVTQLSRNAGILVWWIVWVMAICCFMSE